MKTRKIILATAFCVGALGMFAPRGLMAQGMVYVSNTGDSHYVSGYITSSGIWAIGFTTGANSTGYLLDSIQYVSGGFDSGSGSPGGFSLSLYLDNSGQPGTVLQQLSGTDDPANETTYSYSASGITLSPSSTYWIVLAESQSETTYFGEFTSSPPVYTSSDGWSLGSGYEYDSGTWSSSISSPKISVTAEPAPVPEPGTLALAGLGLSALFLRRKK